MLGCGRLSGDQRSFHQQIQDVQGCISLFWRCTLSVFVQIVLLRQAWSVEMWEQQCYDNLVHTFFIVYPVLWSVRQTVVRETLVPQDTANISCSSSRYKSGVFWTTPRRNCNESYVNARYIIILMWYLHLHPHPEDGICPGTSLEPPRLGMGWSHALKNAKEFVWLSASRDRDTAIWSFFSSFDSRITAHCTWGWIFCPCAMTAERWRSVNFWTMKAWTPKNRYDKKLSWMARSMQITLHEFFQVQQCPFWQILFTHWGNMVDRS